MKYIVSPASMVNISFLLPNNRVGDFICDYALHHVYNEELFDPDWTIGETVGEFTEISTGNPLTTETLKNIFDWIDQWEKQI